MLPFTRFPGSDPVLGPEMRSTGEVMASAADFPTAFAKAERAAGRRLPDHGTVFLSVRDDEKDAVVPVARALAGLGFDLVATPGTAAALTAAGLTARPVRKVTEAGRGRRSSTCIRRRRCDLVINTPQGSGAPLGRLPHPRGGARRPRAVHHHAGRRRSSRRGISGARGESALSLQERHAQARSA